MKLEDLRDKLSEKYRPMTDSERKEAIEILKALLAVAKAAKSAYGATFDVDGGEGDGMYVSWPDLLELHKALEELENL